MDELYEKIVAAYHFLVDLSRKKSTQVEFVVPTRAVKVRQIVLGELVFIEQCGGDGEGLDTEARRFHRVRRSAQWSVLNNSCISPRLALNQIGRDLARDGF